MSCYLIKSKLSGLVLDVKKGATTAGAPVITYAKHGKDNQLWYDDPTTGTIRSKQTGFCMDLDADVLVVRPYEKDDHNQQWVRDGAFIKSRSNDKKALDIFSENKSSGAKVGAYAFHGKPNQQWEFEMVPGAPAPNAAAAKPSAPPAQVPQPTPSYPLYPQVDPNHPAGPQGGRREFWILSESNQKAIDIQAGSTAAGAKAILWTKGNSNLVKNQLWYLDPQGFIRSTLNDFVFQNTESGKKLKMAPFSNNPRGQWTIDGKKIVNRTGECLDFKPDKKMDDGTVLMSHHYKGSPTQHWVLQYV